MAAAMSESELGTGPVGEPPPSPAQPPTKGQAEQGTPNGEPEPPKGQEQQKTKDQTDLSKGDEKEKKQSKPFAAEPPEHHQVLIIGGGVSGLSAASCLAKNGVTDFRLLEARGRLGGRVVAITVGEC